MPDMQEGKLPAVLLHGFEDFEACRGVALQLLEHGFPVIVAGLLAGETNDVARKSGSVAVEAEQGEALRAGLEYFKANMEGLAGIIAMDGSDGYSVDDVLKMADALNANPGKFILASRADNPGAGLLPRVERLLVWGAFALVHGRSVRDPWSGLLALQASLVPAFLGIGGERRGYGFNMALNLQHMGIKAVSVPVSAKYPPVEGPDFWKRAGDILRVLLLPFKFISASLLATLADYAVFLLLDTVLLPGHWAISMTTSRTTGAVIGYFLNRNLVFRRKNNTKRKELAAAAMFALLALFNYGASMLIVYLLHDLLHINEIIARFISDMLLFVSSYTIQRELIFRRGSTAVKE